MTRKKLSDLTPDARNANKGTDRGRKLLQGSIRELGAGRSILIDKNDCIIAGNKTAEAAPGAGITKVRIIETDGTEIIAVKRTDLDLTTDAVAKKLAIADNRVGEVSMAWDPVNLAAMADEVDLGELFSAKEIGGLLASVRPESGANDDAPDLPKKAITKLGDVYVMGKHRLVCGDSTERATVDLALEGHTADCIWTDPPYGVAYGSKMMNPRADGLKVMKDDLDTAGLSAFMRAIYNNAGAVLKPGGAIYVSHSDAFGHVFRQTMIDSGLEVRQVLIWRKDVFTLGRQDYQWAHEPILYGWKPGGPHHWFSNRKQTTILEFDRPKKSKEHPTMKPVALVQYCLENSTKKGETVLDLFGGSGTTLMACEASGRKAALVELDPKYCDVIVTRWQQATSNTAELIRR